MKFGEWVQRFQGQYEQYLNELGEMGETTARDIFATAPADEGNTDATVERTPNVDGGFQIRATGHDVMFIEFGTGVQTAVLRDTVQSDVPIADGSYSQANKGPYFRNGFWYYNGHRFTGTAPLGGMQEACNAMEQWSSTIAGRVFG